MRSLETALQSAEQYQNQNDNQDQAQAAARAVTPTTAIRPCRQRAEQDQHQYDDQNRTKHDVSLSRTMPDENSRAGEKFRCYAHSIVIPGNDKGRSFLRP